MNLHDNSMFFHLLWLLPMISGATYLEVRRRNLRLRSSFADEIERESANRDVSFIKRRVRRGLMGLVLLFCVVAVARPQWGHSDLGISSAGGDVTIILDVSRSMYARDIKPDRLTVAKNLIEELMAALPSHRFSLVVFAGKAYTACPMTNSRTSLQMILDDVSPTTMPYGGTNLESGLAEVLSSEDGAETTNRTVVIVSDGDLQQGSLDTLLVDFRKTGIPVMAIGVGLPNSEALIQLPDNNFVRFNDKPVRTSLDSAALKTISQQTGGAYWQADNEPLLPERLAKAISQYQPLSVSESRISRPTERFQLPVVCALICLGAAGMVGDKKRLSTALVALIFLTHVSPSLAEDIPETVVTAELAFVAEADPARKVALQYQFATVLQAEKEGDRAVAHYKSVILSNYSTATLRAAAMQNLATLYYAAGDKQLEDTPAESIAYFNKVIVLCKTILEIRYEDVAVKSLESAREKRVVAERRYRDQEELKRLKANAAQAVKVAADAQAQSNKGPTKESQTKAKTLTETAVDSTSKLKDNTLDSYMNQALKYQSAILNAEGSDHSGAIREEAMDMLVKALEHLGVKYRNPKDNSQQNAPPPKELPKDQQFDEVKDKKKRAVMILREMRKEEENQRKEIRDAREKAFRARLGEERDW